VGGPEYGLGTRVRTREPVSDVDFVSVRVLYDAGCGFCTRSVETLARLGASADFTPLQTADLESLGVDRERATRELPSLLADGSVVYGAAAFAAALRTGPRWMRLLGRLIGSRPILPLAQIVYRWVAANRQRLPAGTQACALS